MIFESCHFVASLLKRSEQDGDQEITKLMFQKSTKGKGECQNIRFVSKLTQNAVVQKYGND